LSLESSLRNVSLNNQPWGGKKKRRKTTAASVTARIHNNPFAHVEIKTHRVKYQGGEEKKKKKNTPPPRIVLYQVSVYARAKMQRGRGEAGGKKKKGNNLPA